jgi:hypothetical protein
MQPNRAHLTPVQQATLESLERYAVRWGYHSLTRREQSLLTSLRALSWGVTRAAYA